MSTSDDYQVPVRDGHAIHPKYTAPEEMYWLSHLNQEDLCEKYVGLRDDFYTLKKFSCKQEDKIKKKKVDMTKGSTSFSTQEIEYQDALETHRHSIRDLQLKNDHLEKKLKLASIQLSTAKKNKPLLFRHVGPRVDSGRKQIRTSVTPQVRQPPQPSSSPSKPVHQPDPVLPEKIREILEEARGRILSLEAERDDLQEELIEKQQAYEDAEYDLQQEIAMMKDELQDRGVREENDSVAVVCAERKTRTLSARNTALHEQLVITEEKVEAERTRKEALQNELERITGKLLLIENQLRELQQEHQNTVGQLQQVTEKKNVLQNENSHLQKENERLTSLNLTFEKRGLASENESLKSQIAQLESALQSDLIERGTFLEHMNSDKEALAKVEVEVKTLRERNIKLQEDLEETSRKLNIFSKAGLLDLTEEDLTSSLKKQKEDASHNISLKEFEEAKHKHSELQLLYREKTLELERITATLTTHSETYKALQNQVSRVAQESQEKEKDLCLSIKGLQETIKRRDERCEKMEHQILMITDKSLKEKLDGLGHNLTQTLNLGKHDNVLQFHIDKIVFEGPEFSQLKTFASWTVPFSLEDPLQHTNVAIGNDAHYNYSALYRFQMNYRNLESLREDNVTVSVYILLDSGHPTKIGECQLTFCEVLDYPRNTLHGSVQVLVSYDDAEEMQHLPSGLYLQPGQVIGTLRYWFNLQRACEEVIAQHLRTVGVLGSTQHYEDFIPKASKTIKAKNPVKQSKNGNKEQQGNAEQSSSDMSKGKTGVKRASKVKHPSPAPRSQSHASLLLETQQTSSQEGEISKHQQKTLQYPSPTDKHAPVMQVKSGSHSDGEANNNVLQDQCSQSQSVSSARSYNGKSPSKTNINDTSDQEDCRSHSSIKSKRTSKSDSLSKSNQSTSHVESPHLDKTATQPKFVAADKSVSESSMEIKGISVIPENCATSPIPHKNHPQVFRQHAYSDENSSPESSKDNSDTMFEESSESDTDSRESQHKMVQKGPTQLIAEAQCSEAFTRKESIKGNMSIHGTRVQQVQSTSSPGTSSSKSHATDSQLSLTESNLATDSEGVVAVASKIKKDKQLKIYVEVCNLTLHGDSSVIQDPSVEFLFVDYHGFLGLPPDQLETPVSLPKPPPGRSLNFNFGQEFSISKQYPEREQALVDLMKNRGIIKFTVTSEPSEELQDIHDCQDLGYAFVNLHELLRKGQDLQDEDLVVEC
ncbi:protein fantom-like isoform X2 [Homarus americanus]|uniref:protein fantom-like isoform X2 n=1 Tax=Homarus americanus TaxID=6706 RepID=UPI001C466EEE|nr:protein fantom-like isoform X2 [Homarus americanus]